MNEILITKLEVPNPTAITKRMEYGLGRVRFGVDGIYTLADGRTLPTRVTAERKKDVPRAIEREIDACAKGATSATFNDEGKYWGTVSRWTIGAGGFAPEPQKPANPHPLPFRDSVLPEVLPSSIFTLGAVLADKAKESPRARGIRALDKMAGFIGQNQRRCVDDLLRGEEAEYFANRMTELAALIEGMASTGQTDGQGQNAIAQLHYFAGGSANWWITEKDIGNADDEAEGIPPQSQAFGLANLFGGPADQDAELGYISIAEILANGGELDFHFTPRTLRELQQTPEKEPAKLEFEFDGFINGRAPAELPDGRADYIANTGRAGEEIDSMDKCRKCGAPADDGEGWDGLCGNCADAKEPGFCLEAITEEVNELLGAPADVEPDPRPQIRAATIERIISAARRPCPPIVERHYLLCSDGQYRSPFGIPSNVSVVEPHETMFMGCVFQSPDGSTYGTLDGSSREDLEARHAEAQGRSAEEFRAQLEAMTDERLDSQAAYWLKTAPTLPPEPPAQVRRAETAPGAPESRETGKSGTVRINRQHAGIEVLFPSKPSPAIIGRLKANKFRWSSRSRVWYRKASTHALAAAISISGMDTAGAAPLYAAVASLRDNPEPDRHDMMIEDQMAEACGVGL